MSRRILFLVVASALVSGLLLWALYTGPSPEDAREQERQQAVRSWVSGHLTDRLPDFSMPDLEGQERDIAEWQGDVLVINFWATWCAPCREEVPLLKDIQARYGDQGLTVIGIALDEPEAVRQFAADFAINYPVLVGEEEARETAALFGSDSLGLPHTLVVNRRGELVGFHLGLVRPEDVETLLDPISKELRH